MHQARSSGRAPGTQSSAEAPGSQPIEPGKRTLTEGLVVQRREAGAGAGGEIDMSGAAVQRATLPAVSSCGPRLTLQMLFGVQQAGTLVTGSAEGRASGSGSPLPSELRARMERAFGADFSAVRVHQDGRAQALHALAYTDGTDIHMAPGQYDPDSEKGQALLGHELAHVVQQRAGRVAAEAPIGEGAAINRDPSLEAEADQAGARAARGEPAGIAGGGAASGAGTATGTPIVQRYADVQLDNADWKLSDGHRILTRKDASQEMYAYPHTIAAGEAALATAGSFIRLAGQAVAPAGVQAQGQVVQHGLQKVVATYRPRGATADAAQTPAAHKGAVKLDAPRVPGMPMPREDGLASLNQNGAGPLVTPAQCIDAARVVMGVLGFGGARDKEMAVDGQGHVHAAQPERDFEAASFQNLKHAPSSTEASALTALNRQLIDFVDSRELGVLDAQPARRVEVSTFRQIAKQLHRDNPGKAWTVLHELQQQAPAVYQAFTGYAGIDAAATPQVGDALVTYIAETKEGAAFKTNRALYNALVAQLGAPTVAQMGITTATSVPQIKAIVDAAAKPHNANYAHRAGLDQAFGAHEMWNMHWAGIVLTDGTDHASLENDASTKLPSRATGTDAAATATGGDINASWRYQLYGSARPGQSFHDHMLAGGDFGDHASTARFRRAGLGEQAMGKPQATVYALRMPAGTSPALVDQMQWELLGHDAGAAAGASSATFAATLTTEAHDQRPDDVRMADVTILDRSMPPGVREAIEQALELVDVWQLRSPGAPVVALTALRDRLRRFPYAVKYLLSLGDKARPVDKYVSAVSRGARKHELDAEVRPGFAPFRLYAKSVEELRTPKTEDGLTVGLLFQMLSFLDWNVLGSYERGEVYFDTAPLLASYRQGVAHRKQEIARTPVREEALRAAPVMVQCEALFAQIEKLSAQLKLQL